MSINFFSLNKMHVIESYEKSYSAVTRCLKAVISYMKKADKKLHGEFAQLYAPKILDGRRKPNEEKRGLIVFDIDDTVLFGQEDVKPNKNVIKLLKKLKSLGAEVHLITARMEHPEVEKMTIQELVKVEIMPEHYNSLSLAPDSYRTSMAEISRWKMLTRKKIANVNQIPITLTVGDQWGDMIVLENDSNIEDLDGQHKNTMYHFVRPNDKVSLWGLKLPSYK